MKNKMINTREAMAKLNMERWVDWFWSLPPSFHRSAIRRSAQAQPTHIYKYRGLESPEDIFNAKSAIVDARIWLSHKDQLNDPNDLDYCVVENMDVEVRKRWLARNSHLLVGMGVVDRIAAKNKMLWQKMDERDFEKAKQEIWENNGVFCASSDPRNMHMWTHYASNGRGISIQFSTHSDPIFGLLKQVIYKSEMPTLLYPSDEWDEVYLHKGITWEMEKEWRIVLGHSRTLVEIDRAAVVGVIVGYAASPRVEQWLHELNEERILVGAPPFKIWKAVTKPRSYDIEIRRA